MRTNDEKKTKTHSNKIWNTKSQQIQTLFNRFKAGLFGHRRKLGGGRAYPRSLNACIFVNTRAKVSKKITISQEFYKLFCQSLMILKLFMLIMILLIL